MVKNAENTTNEKKTTKRKSTTNAKKENNGVLNLEESLVFKKVERSTLSFNKDKSVDEKLKAIATANGQKEGTVLNEIFSKIIDIENKKCLVDIDTVQEKKIQNTYKVDKDYLEVIKTEADKRNMSINEYLNLVMKKAFNL